MPPLRRTGTSRWSLGATLVATTAVTVAVALPLYLIAGRGEPRVETDGLLLSTGAEESRLNNAVVELGADVVLVLESDDLAAAAFGLYDGDRQVAVGEVRGGPRVSLLSLTQVDLEPGEYDLLVTARDRSGDTQKFGAEFIVTAT